METNEKIKEKEKLKVVMNLYQMETKRELAQMHRATDRP